MKHHINSYWDFGNGMIICGSCFDKFLDKTAKGKFIGDEAVTTDMATKADPKEGWQCDNCLRQSDNYDSVLDEYER